MHPKVAKTRSAVGVAARRGDPLAVSKAKVEHAAAKVEDYIERTVAAAPPLSPAQQDRLCLLLRGGGAEPPGGPPSIRRNTSAEAVAQPRRKSRELTSLAEQAEAELAALGGGDSA